MKTVLSIILVSFSGLSAFATPATHCVVRSLRYPELQSGINASTICGETLRELNNNSLIAQTDTVVITEAGRSQYQVNLKVSVKSDSRPTDRKLAVLSWYPGGDVYVELVDTLPPQDLAAPARTGEYDQDRP